MSTAFDVQKVGDAKRETERKIDRVLLYIDGMFSGRSNSLQ